MASLVALLSSGRGTWTQVLSLITAQTWEKIYLICDEQVYSQLTLQKENIIKIKFSSQTSLFSEVFENLKKISDFEVALNIESGTGFEHMALMSAVLKSGLGIRFVYLENKKVKEFELLEEDFSLL